MRFFHMIAMPSLLAIIGLLFSNLQMSDAVKKCMDPKLGTCLDASPGFLTICLVSCIADQDCPGVQKCCNYGCRTLCTNPIISKPGNCPIPPNGTLTTCDVQCQNDSQCYGIQKCCHYGCRIACYNPV